MSEKVPAQKAPAQRGKASITARCAARGVDFCVVLLLIVVLPHPVGVLLGLLYTLFQDALLKEAGGGQSLGKRLLKLHVHCQEGGGPITLRESAIRNSPLAVAQFFAIIPFWGWIILILLGVPLVLMEIYLMKTKPSGERLGDVMAETEVLSE